MARRVSVFAITIVLSLSLTGCASMFDWVTQSRMSAPAPINNIPSKIKYYKVKQGDRLYTVARKFNLTERAIILWNGLAKPFVLKPGQVLQLFPSSALPIKKQPVRVQTVKPTQQKISSSNQIPVTIEQQPEIIPTTSIYPRSNQQLEKTSSKRVSANGIYVVKPGDTLLEIGKSFNLTLSQIASYNNLEAPYIIFVDKKLKLYKPVTKNIGKPKLVLKSVPPQEKNTQQDKIKPITKLSKPAVNKAAVKTNSTIKQAKNTSIQKTTDSFAGITWQPPLAGKLSITDDQNKGDGSVLIAAANNDPVYAAASGRILYAGVGTQGFGEMVIISHGKGYLSAYSDLNNFVVKEGNTVNRGAKIGTVGSYQGATNLGFEVRKDGELLSLKQLKGILY